MAYTGTQGPHTLRGLRSGVAGLIVLLAAFCSLSPSSASGAPMPPSTDPFYAPPPGLQAASPGTILRSRQVTVNLGLVPLTGAAYSAYQLLYRTNDATNHPVANVTTVIVPTGAPPSGGRTLVSLQDAEDSLDSTCAPSYQLQIGESSNGNLAAESALLLPVLAQGRDVVIPDAEGPQSQYIVTGMEGHATLDSIRAVERFSLAELSGEATRVALMGYSGGAHETAAASELQPAYAPGLKIVGVAAGGVPVGNEQNAQYLDGSVGAGLLVGLAVSLNRAYPEINVASLLNANGQALAQRESSGCATAVFAAPFTHLNDYTTIPNALELARVKRVIELNSLGHATPIAPTFYYNAIHDELIWIKPLDQLVEDYCASGAQIDYYRDPVAQEHIEALHDFVPLALSYVEDRFAGKPIPDTCSPRRAQTGSRSACIASHWLTLRLGLPAGLPVRRIVVMLGGRVVRSLHRRVSTVRINVGRHLAGLIHIRVRIVFRSHGQRREFDRRFVRGPCVSGWRSNGRA